jgi:hypothetical protein
VKQKSILSLLVLIILGLTSGCAVNKTSATVSPDVDLSKVKTFYVIQQPKDQRGVERIISDNLTARGFKATAGPDPGKPPADVDAVVTYVDKWMWDLTMYLVELTVVVRDPRNNYPMATANSFHTSMTRKSPPEMVDEVLTNIFNAQSKNQGVKQ